MIEIGNRRLLLSKLMSPLNWTEIFGGVVKMEQALFKTRSLKKRDEKIFVRLEKNEAFFGLDLLGPPQKIESEENFFIKDTSASKIIEERVLEQLPSSLDFKFHSQANSIEIVVDRRILNAESEVVEIRLRQLNESYQ